MAAVDVGPVRVLGPVKSNRARVFWRDGVLYVAAGRNAVKSIETSEPVRSTSGWVATTTDGAEITFTSHGCPRCGWTLHRVDADQLVAAARPALRL